MKSKNGKQRLGRVLALAVTFGVACGAHPENTASQLRRGSPPLCFQYHGEARPSPSGRSSIWLLANNTCSYTVDCLVWDDVTKTEHRILLPRFETNSYILASETPASRVNFKLDCTWEL